MKRFFMIITWLYFTQHAVMAYALNSDDYLTGYIQSIFINSYYLASDAVIVKNGIVFINEDKLGHYPPDQILQKTRQSTSGLPNVREVKLVKDISKENSSLTNTSKTSKKTIFTQTSNSTTPVTDGIMPNHSLFQPLIADPKWPRFTLAYQYHYINRILRHAFAPNFGASFSLYREMNNETDKEWEISMHAGLFGIMDVGRKPSALINADYFVGVPIAYRTGSFSTLLRPYHMSTHLGDEFMLTSQGKETKRINLSYEGVDLLLSYNFNSLRVYGGGGYIVHKEPSYVKPFKIQIGSEYYSHYTFMGGRLRPVAGIDLKIDQNANWYPGVSIKTGVQIENSALISNKVLLMLEFYSGKSMHGQFFKDKIQTIGIGLHAFL